MNIEEWNELKPGDYIQRKGTDIRYMVHAIGEAFDCDEPDGTIKSRVLWIDPLLSPKDPYYPDITEYWPGECDRFDRVEQLKGEPRSELKPMTRAQANQIMQDWYDAWYAQRSPYCQRLSDQEQWELWHAHLRELIRTKDPKMLAELRASLYL